MKNEALLMIFARNPVKGKVKTRLAADLGEEEALVVYKELLKHTKTVCEQVSVDKIVFYSDFIEMEDVWTGEGFFKVEQHGEGLGERMRNAFFAAFEAGNSPVIIIGTDCFELTSAIISEAFEKLKESDVVVGPALDGGYYLLGMKKYLPQLFDGIQWSTATVCQETLNKCHELNACVTKLSVLADIDTKEDLENSKMIYKA